MTGSRATTARSPTSSTTASSARSTSATRTAWRSRPRGGRSTRPAAPPTTPTIACSPTTTRSPAVDRTARDRHPRPHRVDAARRRHHRGHLPHERLRRRTVAVRRRRARPSASGCRPSRASRTSASGSASPSSPSASRRRGPPGCAARRTTSRPAGGCPGCCHSSAPALPAASRRAATRRRRCRTAWSCGKSKNSGFMIGSPVFDRARDLLVDVRRQLFVPEHGRLVQLRRLRVVRAGCRAGLETPSGDVDEYMSGISDGRLRPAHQHPLGRRRLALRTADHVRLDERVADGADRHGLRDAQPAASSSSVPLSTSRITKPYFCEPGPGQPHARALLVELVGQLRAELDVVERGVARVRRAATRRRTGCRT